MLYYIVCLKWSQWRIVLSKQQNRYNKRIKELCERYGSQKVKSILDTMSKVLQCSVTELLDNDNDFWDELSAALINYPDRSLVFTNNSEPIGAWFNKKNWVENLNKSDIQS